jgi:hypothetical protein
MRTITDSTGVEWTIFEVKRLNRSQGAWSYLPEEYEEGWLCFESPYGKRRLTPVPRGWRQMASGQLEQLRLRAQPVVRTRPTTEDEATPG